MLLIRTMAMRLLSVTILVSFSAASQHLQLKDGKDRYRGRVEILFNNSWGTICDDGFTTSGCRVVCRQLGLSGGICIAHENVTNDCIARPNDQNSSDFFPIGLSTSPIWLSEVRCVGTEQLLVECQHSNWGQTNCLHKEDIGCRCQPAAAALRSMTSPGSSRKLQRVLPTVTHRQVDTKETESGVARDDSSCNAEHYRLLPFAGLREGTVGVGLIAVRGIIRSSNGNRLLDVENDRIDTDVDDEEMNQSFSGDTMQDLVTDWGLICDDTWDDVDAATVCNCLGFGNHSAARALYNVVHSHDLPISIDKVHCPSSTSNDRGLAGCDVVPVRNGQCNPRTESAAVACIESWELDTTEVEATLSCDQNIMTACLSRDSSLATSPSYVIPRCREAILQTNEKGFCYVIDMAACQSTSANIPIADHTQRQYCYEIAYNNTNGLLQTLSVPLARHENARGNQNVTGAGLDAHDSRGFDFTFTNPDGTNVGAVGLRVQIPVARQKFCCDVKTAGNSVTAVLQPYHKSPPEVRQIHRSFNLSMSCYEHSSARHVGPRLQYPALVESGAMIHCRVDADNVWDARLQLVVPNCSFTAVPPTASLSYQFIRNNCPASRFLNIRFASFGRLSVGFQTRIAKFDGFDAVQVSCTSKLCDPNIKMASDSGNVGLCDRSCGAGIKQYYSSSATTTTTTTTTVTSVDLTSVRQFEVALKISKRDTSSTPVRNDRRQRVVSEGPFVVTENGYGLVVTPNGSLLTSPRVRHADLLQTNALFASSASDHEPESIEATSLVQLLIIINAAIIYYRLFPIVMH